MQALINKIKKIAQKPITIRTAGYVLSVFLGFWLLKQEIDSEWLQTILGLSEATEVSANNSGKNETFQSAIYIFILTFLPVTYNWFLKNKDTTQQLEDASNQLDNASRQQTETILSNALTLLFREGDKEVAKNVRSNGLKELLRLKYNNPDKAVQERIDKITSSGLHLVGANLADEYLISANIKGANLKDANLKYAKIKGANLEGADLDSANLTGVNLKDANLKDATLVGAILLGADLNDTDLTGANFTNAILVGATLVGAVGANLKGAHFKI